MPCLLSLRDTLNGDAAKMDFATPPFFFAVLFPRKRRVVSSKTTCHFLKNDKSLFEKRQVVSSQPTGRFYEYLESGKSHKIKHKRIPRISFVKIPMFTLPHARTRTRTLQEFSLFCCHKCHKFFTTHYFSEH